MSLGEGSSDHDTSSLLQTLLLMLGYSEIEFQLFLVEQFVAASVGVDNEQAGVDEVLV